MDISSSYSNFHIELCIMSLYIHIKVFMHFGQDAAQAFSEIAHRRNPDFNKLFAGNSKPGVSLMTGESREYGNQSHQKMTGMGPQ
jgi:hypothetical protein